MQNHNGAAILHDTLTVLDANRQACEMFECDLEWLLDRKVEDLVIEELRQLVNIRMNVLRDKGSLPEWEIQFLRPDGSIFIASVKSDRIEKDDYQSSLLYRMEW